MSEAGSGGPSTPLESQDSVPKHARTARAAVTKNGRGGKRGGHGTGRGGGRRKKTAPPPKGAARTLRCRSCVARLVVNPSHKCCNQASTGGNCWDCAKLRHTCPSLPVDPNVVQAVRALEAAAAAYDDDTAVTVEAFNEAGNHALRVLRDHPVAGAVGGRIVTGAFTPAPPQGTDRLFQDLGSRAVVALEGINNSLISIANYLDVRSANEHRGRGGAASPEEEEEEEDGHGDDGGEADA